MFLVCGPFLHFPAHLCRLCLHRHSSYVLCCSHIYSASSFRTAVITFRDNPRGSPHFKIFHSPTRTEPLCYVRNSSRFWGLGCWHCGATLRLTSMSKRMTFLSGGAVQRSMLRRGAASCRQVRNTSPSHGAGPTPQLLQHPRSHCWVTRGHFLSLRSTLSHPFLTLSAFPTLLSCFPLI